MFKIMKKIAHEIYEEEKKQYNLKGEMLPVTIIDYYKYNIFNKKLKLFKEHKAPIRMSGWNGIYNGKQIFINLSYSNRMHGPCRNIFEFVKTCYHEIRHEIQKQFSDFSYEKFTDGLSTILSSTEPLDYRTEHDSYSVEIGANLYGITKAEKYLKEKYPHYYEENKALIEQKKQEYLFDYMTYDASNTFDIAIDSAKKYILIADETDIDELHTFKEIEIFVDYDFDMKSIREIMNNENFYKLDKRIIYAVFSSRNFLESLDWEELSEVELNLILESLQYTNTVYQNQIKWLEKEKKIKLKDKLKAEEELLIKISVIERYIDHKIYHKLNKTRNDKKNQEHKDSLPGYIEKTNTLIRKRTKRGYITIDIFYIIGFILSILTITFLIISK